MSVDSSVCNAKWPFGSIEPWSVLWCLQFAYFSCHLTEELSSVDLLRIDPTSLSMSMAAGKMHRVPVVASSTKKWDTFVMSSGPEVFFESIPRVDLWEKSASFPNAASVWTASCFLVPEPRCTKHTEVFLPSFALNIRKKFKETYTTKNTFSNGSGAWNHFTPQMNVFINFSGPLIKA